MRSQIVLFAHLSIVSFVLAAAAPASAASFLRVTYEVRGGDFDGPALNGTITGGSISIRFPDGVTTWPPCCLNGVYLSGVY